MGLGRHNRGMHRRPPRHTSAHPASGFDASVGSHSPQRWCLPVRSPSLQAVDSTFSECESEGRGGAVYLMPFAVFRAERTVFRGNHVSGGEGGVLALPAQTTATLVDCAIEHASGSLGGAISIESKGILELHNSVFRRQTRCGHWAEEEWR